MVDADDVTIDPDADIGEGETAPEAKLKKLRDELKKVQGERDDHLAGWQRAKADYINLQKRVRDAGEGFSKAGVVALATDIIAVYDSLEAAGVESIIKQLDAVLTRHGVTRFVPNEGDPFDPTREEAVSTVATEAKAEDNTIHRVLQSGFVLGELTLRPARVVVKSLA